MSLLDSSQLVKYKVVSIVPENSSGQVTIAKDGFFVTNEKVVLWITVILTVSGIQNGQSVLWLFYWRLVLGGEDRPRQGKIDLPVTVLTMKVVPGKIPEPHWRLGWSTTSAELQAPGNGSCCSLRIIGLVGYDKHSYAYRDIDGVKVHQAKRRAYGKSYGPGDVIGFYIYLPEENVFPS